MEKERTKQEIPESTKCTMKIEYKDSLRSIDLEHLLTGTRMIIQHDLANRLNKKPRNFTDITQITGIEKGSIEISYLINWAIENKDLLIAGLDFAGNMFGLAAAIIGALSNGITINIGPTININSNNKRTYINNNYNTPSREISSREKDPLEMHKTNFLSALRNTQCVSITENGICTKFKYDEDKFLYFTQEQVIQ